MYKNRHDGGMQYKHLDESAFTNVALDGRDADVPASVEMPSVATATPAAVPPKRGSANGKNDEDNPEYPRYGRQKDEIVARKPLGSVGVDGGIQPAGTLQTTPELGA